MKGTNRQYRLEQLRLREAEGTLTEREQAELLAIFAELDAEEAEALKPAKEKSQRLREEKAEGEGTYQTRLFQKFKDAFASPA